MGQRSTAEILASMAARRAPDPVPPPSSPDDDPSLLRRVGRGALTVMSPIPAVQRAALKAGNIIEGIDRPDQPAGGFFGIPGAIKAIPDVLGFLVDDPIATIRAYTAGAVEGLGDVFSPLDFVAGGAAGVLRAARPFLRIGGEVAESSARATRTARRTRVREAIAEPPPVRRKPAPSVTPAVDPTDVTERIVQRHGVRVKTPTPNIPPTDAIPRSRLLAFPSLQKQPEEVREAIATLLENNQGFPAQRRGVQSVARTEALSEGVELPLHTLKPGTAINAEELTAYKNTIAWTFTQRRKILHKINTGTASDLEKVEFSQLSDEAVVLVSSFRGAKAETGRALNSLRQKAYILDMGRDGIVPGQEQTFLEALSKYSGHTETTRLAKMLVEAGDDPVKQLRILREQASGTLFDKFSSAYYNSLLSGVKTHLRNGIGNSFNAMSNLATPLGAAPVDVVRAAVTGTPRTVFLGEIPHAFVGSWIGLKQGLHQFAFTMKHGFTPKTVGRAAQGAFDRPRIEIPGGIVTNFPSRALEASDVFFRAIARNQELYAGAYAQARREGLRTLPKIQRRMADLLTDTGRDGQRLVRRAENFAARAVFQEKPGSVTAWLLKAKSPDKPIWQRTLATAIMPFVRTPLNIIRQGLEFSPAGAVMSAARQGGREGTQAMGRVALGTMSTAALVVMAAEGRLSGFGPRNRGEREALFAKKWKPNAVRIGDTWVSFRLFQPFSVAAAAVGNAWDRFIDSDQSDSAAEDMVATVAGSVGSILDQSFFASLNDVLNAINDPDRAGQSLSLMSQGLVPASGLLRNITQAVDPVVRRPEGILEAMMTVIPGVSKRVPARLGRFGEEITRPGSPIRRGFVVPTFSTESQDDIGALLERLDITLTVPRTRFTVRGERVTLSREQQFSITQAIGAERRSRLEQLLAQASFDRGTEDRQRRRVEAAIRDATDVVRARVLQRLKRNEDFSTSDIVTSRVGASLEELLKQR